VKGIWELSVLSLPLFCKSKIIPKLKAYCKEGGGRGREEEKDKRRFGGPLQGGTVSVTLVLL
jgi:hypothetical protein